MTTWSEIEIAANTGRTLPSNQESIRHRSKKNHAKRKRRVAVFVKDKGICCYCGRKVPLNQGSIEHIIPRSKGGTNDQTNLRWSCKRCNHVRGTKPVTILESGMLRIT